MARPVFTKHAREQMKLRNISFKEVRALLRSHSVTVTEGRERLGEDRTEWLRGTVEGRRLKVLVTVTDPPRVVTAGAADE